MSERTDSNQVDRTRKRLSKKNAIRQDASPKDDCPLPLYRYQGSEPSAASGGRSEAEEQ